MRRVIKFAEPGFCNLHSSRGIFNFPDLTVREGMPN